MQRLEVSGAVRPIYVSLGFRMSGPIRVFPPYVFMECIWKTFTVFTSLWAKYWEF